MNNKIKVVETLVKVTPGQVCESDSILAFTETPASEAIEGAEGEEQQICACDLFSFFTADIIKSETLFIR
jgi:hypothetical protein